MFELIQHTDLAGVRTQTAGLHPEWAALAREGWQLLTVAIEPRNGDRIGYFQRAVAPVLPVPSEKGKAGRSEKGQVKNQK